MKLDRITSDPEIMGGRACVRQTRVPVSVVLKLLAGGMSPQDVLSDYQYLEAADIQQCVAYAAMLADDRVLETVH